MDTYRIMCKKVKKFCLCSGDLMDPVKDWVPTVLPYLSLYQEAKWSVMEGQRADIQG